MSGPDSLAGLWQRLILSQPGQPVDAATRVDWLQGPALFVDLRQPADMAGRVTARCLAELTPADMALLVQQEGFAGRLRRDGDLAEWQRLIDFRPSPLGDRGRLEAHGDLLIEHGVEADYIEHWQREPAPAHGPSGAALLVSDEDEVPVILVRHGARFGYARGRAAPLDPAEGLPARLARASAGDRHALLDCEIALGTVTAAGWRIDRSSLPWREGALLLTADALIAQARLVVNDLDAAGRPFGRTLRLRELHGSLLPSDGPDLAPRTGTAAVQPGERAGELAGGPAGTAPFTAIPVIDISPLGGDDAPAEAATIAALHRAAREVGFLHVTGHGIAPAVIERLQQAAQHFFALPEAAKRASYIGRSTNHRGYVPEGEEQLGPPGTRPDRKEAFDLSLDLAAASVPAGHPMLGPNQWPDLPGFREDVMAYYAAVFAVGRRLLGGFARALGQPAEALTRLVTLPPSQLRLIHYPHDAAAADAPGIGAHTDYECFTLLLASGPGLEVMNQAGEWVDAPPVPGALVVNIGDMLEYWSGGRFVATSHRVRKVAEERYSFPLFFALDYDTALRPLGQPDAAPLRTGEHLYAQTLQTFAYLRRQIAEGTLALPDAARPVSSFGQEARHRSTADRQPAANPA